MGSDAARAAATSCSTAASIARLPPYLRARRGLGYVPEDRRIFTDLTVRENLEMRCAPQPGGFDVPELLRIFPNLAEMLERPASRMSGGEQQMLAVARTLAANPRVVLLDEPSEGIAPLVVAQHEGRRAGDARARRRDAAVGAEPCVRGQACRPGGTDRAGPAWSASERGHGARGQCRQSATCSASDSRRERAAPTIDA